MIFYFVFCSYQSYGIINILLIDIGIKKNLTQIVQTIHECCGENKITQASLKILDRTMINELIKDIGNRAIFLDYWTKNICVIPKKSANGIGIRINYLYPNLDEAPDITQKNANGAFAKQYSFRSIDEILKENTEGQRILDFFAARKKLFNRHRNKLCHLLLEEAERNKLRVDNDVSQLLAKRIVNRFDGEVETTYFKSPVKKRDSTKNKSEPASGKLISIRNNRTTRGTTHKKTLEDAEHSNENEDPQTQSRVLEHWLTSSPLRLEEILSLNTDDLFEIFQEWSLYKHPSGSELIRIDFKCGKFSNANLAYELWMQFIALLREHADLNKKDNVLYQYLRLIDSTDEEITQDARVAASLMALSHFLPPKFSKKYDKESGYKPSVQSAKETMVRMPTISGDLSSARTEVIQQAAKMREKVQPYIIIVGELKAINDIFVNVDDTLYQVSSVLEAIEICFKAFFVFNLEFPYDSEHLRLLFQRGIYDITTDHDVDYPFLSHILDKLPKLTDANA
ncbi:hypothetical protein QAD02_002781 [Eretmocerus hayati]|uniref:Uncharacterized protein n=1 Tax=Eretmocerus hayati TaxID=131215 RepID=A0ACC2NK97_9HYME|nr:hypothetical protein QAD02_002781 [Eretmocerus hayati]